MMVVVVELCANLFACPIKAAQGAGKRRTETNGVALPKVGVLQATNSFTTDQSFFWLDLDLKRCPIYALLSMHTA